MLINRSIADFAKDVAGTSPVMPGGGCVTALSGLMGVCLMEMALNLSNDWPLADQQKKCELQERLLRLHAELLEYIDADAAAYNKLIAVCNLPEAAQEKPCHAHELEAALTEAIKVPLQVGDACLAAMEIGIPLLAKVKPNIAGDLKVGLFAAKAGIEGALSTAKMNLASIQDETLAEKIAAQIKAQQTRLDKVENDLPNV